MRLLQPLRTREIALLWGGLSLSAIGDQLYTVTLSWVAVAVFGSAAGYLTALQAAVVLFAALGLGRWVDRWSAQRTLIAADLIRMAVLLGLVWSWLALDRPAALPLIVVIVVLAAGQAGVPAPLCSSCCQACCRIGRCCRPPTRSWTRPTAAHGCWGRVWSPFLAGALPTVHFISLDAVSFLLSALALLLIRRRRPLDPVRPPLDKTMWQAGCTRRWRHDGASAAWLHPAHHGVGQRRLVCRLLPRRPAADRARRAAGPPVAPGWEHSVWSSPPTAAPTCCPRYSSVDGP